MRAVNITTGLYPNPQQYLEHFPKFVEAFAGKSFPNHTAYVAEGFAGAALWLPPGAEPDEEPLMELLRDTVAGDLRQDTFAVFEQMGRYHPEQPHWYLPLMGVDAPHQGRGYGSALLRHALARCDTDGLPAYLESSNPRNVSLYQRHGFELQGAIQAGSSPPVFPMLRQPRPRAEA